MYHPVRRKSFGNLIIVISVAVFAKQSLSAKITLENDHNNDNDISFDNNISDFDNNFNDKLYKNDWNGKNLLNKEHRHTIANKVDESGIKDIDIEIIKDKLKASSQNGGEHVDKTANKSNLEHNNHMLHVVPLPLTTDASKSIKIDIESTTEFDLTVIPLTTSEKYVENEKFFKTTESSFTTTPNEKLNITTTQTIVTTEGVLEETTSENYKKNEKSVTTTESVRTSTQKQELNITTTQIIVTTERVIEDTTQTNIVNLTVSEHSILNSNKPLNQSKEKPINNQTSIIKDKEINSNKTVNKTSSREARAHSIDDFTTKTIDLTTKTPDFTTKATDFTLKTIDYTTKKYESQENATEIDNKDSKTPNYTNIETAILITETSIAVSNKTENITKKYPSEEVMFNSTTDTSKEVEDVGLFSELDLDDLKDVPEDYYDAKDVIPTKPPSTDALSVIFDLAGSVVESVAERVVPKGIMDLFKRMQKQSEALEVERLRSREENGGLGQFTRGILKSISSGITKPLNQLMAGARDIGSLDTDRGFVNSVAAGVSSVANVANSLSDAFKNRVQAIYPGTIWCGDGHSAQARGSELGLFFFTDTCCRQHDACKLFIRAGDTKYGLTNTGLFTRSHCGCDQQFRECLRKTNSLVSSQIGLTYFNVLGPQCFRKTHPIVRCTRRTRLTGQKCEEYELDYTKEKMWQWFDNETF